MSDATPILHMLAPQKHMSPFDVNMAADAGYKVIVPYINVELAEVTGLIQDAIFSRPPNYGVRTGFFMGGKDAILALDMLDAAKKAMVPPFECSVFADPAGSFTTAAAMVACVEKSPEEKVQQVLEGREGRGLRRDRRRRICVLDHLGTGRRRSASSSPIAASIASSRAPRSRRSVSVSTEPVRGRPTPRRPNIIANAEVIFAAAAAGVQVVSKEHKALAKNLKVIADVNAVPPPGVEGMDFFMNGEKLPGCDALGVGPLAIGDIKYKCGFGLFKQMIPSDKPLSLDFRHAYALAKELVGIA